MPRKKSKLTHEECLEKKRITERKRKEKIKNDPVKLEELRRKERERYHRKKADGKILLLSQMTPRARRVQQKRNRVNLKAYKDRKKRTQLAKTTMSNQISETVSEDRPVSPSILQRSGSPIPSTSQIQKSSLQTPQRSSRILRSRKLLPEKPHVDSFTDFTVEINSAMSNCTTEPRSFHIEQSSTPIYQPSSPQIAPSISSINSPTSSFAQNSPVSDTSTDSIIIRRDFNNKLRKYQKRKSAEITSLRKTIIRIQKEKEMYRKILFRLKEIIKTSPQPQLSSRIIKSKISPEKRKILNIVKAFYEEDENSKLCPGKNDCITRHKVKKQKRYLTDSLKNLHRKYLDSGHPPISYTTFTRLRPFWIVEPNLHSRDTCLCKPHANMDLLVLSLKNNKIITENSTAEVLRNLTCKQAKLECLQRRCNQCKNKIIKYQEFDNSNSISYYIWEKGTKIYIRDNEEKSANIVKKVQKVMKPLEVIKNFEKELKPFMMHCGNIKNQYESIKSIKDNLAENECLIHIDFSENYNTKYASEVQAVHFGASRSQITLHTSVIYYRSGGEIKAYSFCTASTSLRHDASAVWAHLIPILRVVEEIVPSVCTLHFVSDSPSAQYRNKKIFYLISQLQTYLPNITGVVWHYCECGHGKGAPDGVGGVLKRSADQQVAFGKDIIDIDSLVQSLNTVVTGVKIKIVQEQEITEKDSLLPVNLKTFPGSMNVHQIVWTKALTNRLVMRSLSCIEPVCLYNTIKCCHNKHISFYELPNVTNVCEDVRIEDVIPYKNIKQPEIVKKAMSQKPQIHRFQASKPFLLKRKSTESSPYLDSTINNDSIATPSVSFFENINSDVFSLYEGLGEAGANEENASTSNKDHKDKREHDDEGDDSDDFNIF